MTRHLVLYTGSLCHLCEQARDLIYPLLPTGVVLTETVIDNEPVLKARYQQRIPVLAVVDGEGQRVAEKSWPFSPGQVRRLLADNL